MVFFLYIYYNHPNKKSSPYLENIYVFYLYIFSDMLPSSIRGALLCGLLLLAIGTTVTQADDDAEDDAGDAGGVSAIPKVFILNPFFREIDLHLFYFWFPEFFCFWLGLFSPKGVNCGDGLIIPIWKPYDILTGGERFGRGVLYIILMVWLFIGVSIVSDRFMESIEMITAQEKEVTLKDPKTGRNQTVIVKVSCIKRIPNK